MYEPRIYRNKVRSEGLTSFRVVILETDLFISCDRDLSSEAESYIRVLRNELESYIEKHPKFKGSLKPVAVEADSGQIIKEMAASAKMAGVGPMAAVAGAVAEAVGKHLLKFSPEVIVENGGDIFISTKKDRTIGIYAGKSKLSGKVTLVIEAGDTPCGICTSSATVGHSLSFGKADAVVVLSRSTALADAAATSICNKAAGKDSIDKAINSGRAIKGVEGVLIIIDDALGAWGSIKMVDNQ